jgi:serpin B
VGILIVLPAPGSDFDAFRAQIDAAMLDRLAAELRPMEGEVRLPRFKVAFGAQGLRESLIALGMQRAFTGGDFSGIAPFGLYISDVLHMAVMEVSEEGTAAATAVVMRLGMPFERFRMIVDRPFFCAIRDGSSALALLMGTIVEPE